MLSGITEHVLGSRSELLSEIPRRRRANNWDALNMSTMMLGKPVLRREYGQDGELLRRDSI